MLISDILKAKGSDVVTVGPGDSLAAAARRIADRKKGLAVVCNDQERPLGMISVIDINRAVADHEERAPGMAVRDLMTTDIIVCAPGDSVEEALERMTTHEVRHLPVVQDGTLKGIVNMRDLLRSRFKEAEMTAAEMQRYVFGAGYH